MIVDTLPKLSLVSSAKLTKLSALTLEDKERWSIYLVFADHFLCLIVIDVDQHESKLIGQLIAYAVDDWTQRFATWAPGCEEPYNQQLVTGRTDPGVKFGLGLCT